MDFRDSAPYSIEKLIFAALEFYYDDGIYDSNPILLPKAKFVNPSYLSTPSFSSKFSRSSDSTISITLPTSAVFRMSSFAPAYSILSSALQVTGR